jgi:selenocysteine-specific elongation factor
VVAFPGLRFVVRRLSPKTLIGGGFIDDGSRATFEPAAAETEASTGETLTAPQAAVLRVLHEHGLAPVDAQSAAYAANVREDVARAALEALAETGDALALRRPVAYVDGKAGRELLAHLVAHLEDAERAEPWSMGLTSIALSRLLDVPEPLLVRLLAEFVEDGDIAGRAGYYSTLAHQPSLAPQQRAFFDALIPPAAAQSFVPVAFANVAASVKRSSVAGASKAFDMLLARGTLVKVGDDVYLGSQIAKVQARVIEYLKRNERMTAAEFRDLLGTSRKYAVPLLEWLDARGVTIRSGDHRMLRKRAP